MQCVENSSILARLFASSDIHVILCYISLVIVVINIIKVLCFVVTCSEFDWR